MANTYVQLFVHTVFHIKATSVAIKHEDLPPLFKYIAGTISGLGATAVSVGGIENHVHILSTLPKTLSISDFVKRIKCSSNQFLKSSNPHYAHFAWQDGYGAFSVSASGLEYAKTYVVNQGRHHKHCLFEDECRALYKAYGIEFDEKYAFSY